MECRTGPYGAKPRPAPPNLHERSALFGDITQRRVAIPDRRFGTIDPIFRGLLIKSREQNATDINRNNILEELAHRLIF